MSKINLQGIANATPDQPVEIADSIWWVGHYLKDEPFQCHVYLIKNGNESVLIDPGSQFAFGSVKKKIEVILPFSRIKYFVCQHQDPDITSSMQLIDGLIDRDDAVLVTHWRAQVLLRHYDLKIPFWLVDKNDWALDLGNGRVLEFVFTPYAHFPGAFCTFDRKTGILFTSDIFGGFTEGFSLLAKDEGYFEALRPFHEHYMPSREILGYALSKFDELPVELIAPQHGSIIPKTLIQPISTKLKGLDCGLYLFAKGDTDIMRLSKINQILREITNTMILYRDFRDISQRLLDIVQKILPVTHLAFFAKTEEPGSILRFSAENRYRGAIIDPPAPVQEAFDLEREPWHEAHGQNFSKIPTSEIEDGKDGECLIIPLYREDKANANAAAIFCLDPGKDIPDHASQIIDEICLPLQVAVERETVYRMMDLEREKYLKRSIRDSLTGLYTRFYMHEAVGRMISHHDRDDRAVVGLVMIDIDHFKSINDTYGHTRGDEVLQKVSSVFLETMRSNDVAVRLGGEEFAFFTSGINFDQLKTLAERLRKRVEGITFAEPMKGRQVTVSLGVAVRLPKETLSQLIQRADGALYKAKNTGRNRFCVAET